MATVDDEGIETFLPEGLLVVLMRSFIDSRGGDLENSTIAERGILVNWAENAITEAQVPPVILADVLVGALPIPTHPACDGLRQLKDIVLRDAWVDVKDGEVVLTKAIEFLRSHLDILAREQEDGCQPCENTSCKLHPSHYADLQEEQVDLPENLVEFLVSLVDSDAFNPYAGTELDDDLQDYDI